MIPKAPKSTTLSAALLSVLLVVAGCNADSPQSLIASGKQFTEKNDHKAAAIQYKGALQLDPKSTEARVLLGQALLRSGDPTAAAVELGKALDDKAPAASVLPSLSSALLLSGEYRKLVQVYGELTLDDKPAMAALKSNVATAWGALGDRPKTEAAIAAALAAMPDFGPAQILNARILAGQRKFDEATALVEKVLARDDKLHEGWLLRGEIIEFAKNDVKTAEESYRKALAAEPAYVPAHTALISTRIRARDIPGAKAQADKLRAVLPNHPLSVLVDSQLAFLDRDLPKAREGAQKLLRVFPDHTAILILAGAIEAESGSVVQAESYFAKAVQLNPSLEVARRNLAEADVRLGQHAKALEVLKPMLSVPSPTIDALALAGDAALRLGDPESAEGYFMRAAKLDPNNVRIQTAAALTRMWRGDPVAALSELTALSAKSPETYADEAIFAARMKRREWDAALATLDAMAKKKPNYAPHLELRGRVHLARKDLPAARKAFEDALKADPALFGAVSSLASIDVLEGQMPQAIERLQAAVKANPRNSFALMGLADLKAKSNAPVDEVKKLLTEAIAAAPANADPRVQLMEFSLRRRQFKDALAAAQDALAAMPSDARILESAGAVQMQAGDVEQAMASFRKLVAAQPNTARVHMRLAEVYIASGKRDQAEASVSKALELEPGLASAQSAMVDLLVSSNRQRNALDFVRRIQATRPQHPVGYLLEAAYYTRTRDPEGAIAAYKKGVAKAPSTEIASALYAALYQAGRGAEAETFGASWVKQYPNDTGFEYQLAVGNIARGQLDVAETRLKRVVAANPNNPLALNNMAWVLLHSNKPGALPFAQRAVDLMPDRPALMDTLALALAADKQLPAAVAMQKRALDLSPNDSGLRLGLAKLAIEAGDKVLARQELQRLKDLGPGYPEQAEVTKLMQTL